ncbi:MULTISPECIES: hypothetical protein [Streptomyces]|uniref:Uncharacterized protein n=2 Tax=Streptomyces TaxID=1883 RepID=A0A420V7T3_9ACTN|nr:MULTISPECIES: hypothetical protein [Streptomyces]KNE82249.1 hypothetical protein ADZ36_12175 [Streptomyces fradiae]OFA56701.1 hypothetical protein BEN35_05620 [Streptomyces fradiae]PQM22847.1 hypothetical protein Sfr7A_14210 [Streptomyces xinghaiensis]RKM98017.1 hypothetical protein SFRA_005645 [Streptomyces xinghaiensis]RNC73845.1 hypothetical protein DC095_013330 [Streptomyces xinghaiensis]
MSGEEDLRFGREPVHLITKGLNAAIGELKEIGGATDAVMGSGFQNLALSGMEAGAPELADAFEGFCDRWEWGVRALVEDANELAARLGLAAGLLHEEDRYWAGTLKVTVNSVVATGNPHATEEEIAQQSYREIITPDAPDYSAESFRQAGEDMKQTWLDTGRSVATEGQGGQAASGFRELIGLDDDTYAQGVDEVFGPSPEERAAQREPSQEPGGETSGGER